MIRRDPPDYLLDEREERPPRWRPEPDREDVPEVAGEEADYVYNPQEADRG